MQTTEFGKIINRHKGKNEVVVNMAYDNKTYILNNEYFVTVSRELIEELRKLLGWNNVEVASV